MRCIFILFAILFVGLVYASTMSYVDIWGTIPNIILVFVCCLSVICSYNKALVIVPFAAIVADLLTSDPLGLSLVSMAPIILLVVLFRNIVPDHKFISVIGVTVIGSLIYGFISLLVLASTGTYIPVVESIYHVIILPAIVNAGFALVCYPLISLVATKFLAEPFRLRSV